MSVRRTVRIPLDRITPHPEQQEVFGAFDESFLVDLMASMKASGLRDAVQVWREPTGFTASGYLTLDGHHRVEAARRLGWTKIACVVRDDLRDRAAANGFFYEANLARWSLTATQKVAAVAAIAWAAAEREDENAGPGDHVPVIVQVAKRLGMSTKNAGRYLVIAHALPEIRSAFERGELRLAEAARLARLPESQQARFAAGVASTVSAKPESLEARRDHTDAYTVLLRGARSLLGRIGEAPVVVPVRSPSRLADDEQSVTELFQVLAEVKQAIARRKDAFEKGL